MDKIGLLRDVYTHIARQKIVLDNPNKHGHWYQTAVKLPIAAIETQLKVSCKRHYQKLSGGLEVYPRVIKYANWRLIAEEIKGEKSWLDNSHLSRR